MKSEVYSWRVSTDLKTGLEREARRRKISVAAVLDLAARDWLNNGVAEMDGDDEQPRLRKAASKCFGSLASGDAQRSENARQAVRQRLREHYDR
jgi:type II secretory pathway component PulL